MFVGDVYVYCYSIFVLFFCVKVFGIFLDMLEVWGFILIDYIIFLICFNGGYFIFD